MEHWFNRLFRQTLWANSILELGFLSSRLQKQFEEASQNKVFFFSHLICVVWSLMLSIALPQLPSSYFFYNFISPKYTFSCFPTFSLWMSIFITSLILWVKTHPLPLFSSCTCAHWLCFYSISPHYLGEFLLLYYFALVCILLSNCVLVTCVLYLSK